MTQPEPYRLALPDGPTGGVIFNSPHSGSFYPDEFVARSRLGPLALRASEDAFVDQLFDMAPENGAPLLSAVYPRAWLDLNRSPSEMDPALVDGAASAGINQRIAAGLGVVPRVVSEGRAIYSGKIPLIEAEARVRDVHRPYHTELDRLLIHARDRFGIAILFDCHSMPSEALRAAPRVRGKVPDVVLGDRFGAAAARHIVTETQAAFEAEGFTVARNAPFAGGYITQRYGRPARGLHAVQIELDRALYLDQRRIQKTSRFDDVRNRVGRVVSRLVRIAPDLSALAAE